MSNCGGLHGAVGVFSIVFVSTWFMISNNARAIGPHETV